MNSFSSFLRKNKTGRSGFTLIELLVVIAIIALLSTITIVALSNARMRARDARRKADLKQIRLALDMYYDDYGKYPAAGTCAYGSNCYIYSTAGENWFSVLAPYLSKAPLDPKNNAAGPWITGNFSYSYGNVRLDGQGFDLVGQLENTSDPDRCQLRQYRFAGSIQAGNPWCGTYSAYMYAPQ